MGNENNNALFTTLFSLLNFKNVEIHMSFSVACFACSGSSPNISEYCRTGSKIPEDVATAKPVRQTFHLFSMYQEEENRMGIFYKSFNKCT